MRTCSRASVVLGALWLAVLLSLLVPSRAAAQDRCEGPPELCAQVLELKSKLEAQKALTDKKEAERVSAAAELETKEAERAARMIAMAGVLAVALKMLVSVLRAWRGFFKTDRQKAGLKIATLVIGFLAFLAANIGFGIPWWQSVILAGGGPGAILVHELTKLVPVLRGKRKYVSKSDPPPGFDEKDDTLA